MADRLGSYRVAHRKLIPDVIHDKITPTIYLSFLTNRLGVQSELCDASNRLARPKGSVIRTLPFTSYATFSGTVFVQNIIGALGQVLSQNGIVQLNELYSLSFYVCESVLVSTRLLNGAQRMLEIKL